MKKRLSEEEIRVAENHLGSLSVWDMWGPYLSERSWGTVREDVSVDGDAWNSFPFDHAHLRAYRWGEDGIAGFSDRYQTICFSLALWNGKDPILKERLFGLRPEQSNHGEDVKEVYYYLDNTPSHSYMRYLYKYPQREFPYKRLIEESQKRGKGDPEFEIFDTDAFDDEKYFDLFVSYAKIDYSEIAIKIDVVNCGPETSEIDVIPQVTFRNTWSWGGNDQARPKLSKGIDGNEYRCIEADDCGIEPFPMLDIDYRIGKYYIYASSGCEMYFTENETNFEALGTGKNRSPYTKDAFHRKIIKNEGSTNPKMEGTKACFHYKKCKLAPGETRSFFVRFSQVPLKDPINNTDSFIAIRAKEAEEYYNRILTNGVSDIEKQMQKQAISSQLWSRQLYLLIVNYWLKGGDLGSNGPAMRKSNRNIHWKHMVSKHVIVMPDKWEYPWFAAWDLSFHALTVGLYDLALAKDQIWLLLTDQFQHPNGQIPAYEWEFSDLNPPIQAWVACRLFEMEKEKTGRGDLDFLHRCFEKLLVNFSWWVNRVDARGNNVFEGGFLGLDNIAIFDRSKPLPGGGIIEQSDGTGWMGMFCINLMRMAMELSKRDLSFEPMITKFFQHFVYISNALNQSVDRQEQNWSEKDGFYYDVLCHPDGTHNQIPVRSLVGIIPLFAFDFFEDEELRSFRAFYERYTWYLENKGDLLQHCLSHVEKNGKKYAFFGLVGEKKADRVLSYVWDRGEFKSDFGLRSLSKFYEKNPVTAFGSEIGYNPGESQISMFGGNSNWRGPIWLPINYLFIETIWKMYQLLGDDFVVKNRQGEEASLKEMAIYFSEAIISIWKKDDKGIAPFMGSYEELSRPNWREHLLFHEYFHGDTGEGLGAGHQTGWTALVVNIIDRLQIMRGKGG